MALAKIDKVRGTGVWVPGDDIDTDRIIPARFMKCVTFDGLGEFLFYDVRFHENGERVGHPLDDPRHSGATILISGSNFGCGSSREHAPQAIYRFGLRAVIAESFAEIFFGNSTTLGMPCVCCSREDLEALGQITRSQPDCTIKVDLVSMTVRAGDRSFPCTMKSSAREGLVNGKWDPIAELLEASQQVDDVAARLPYLAAA